MEIILTQDIKISKSKEDYHVFYFPFTKKSELLPVWERFVNRSNWKPSTNSVICDLHFEENLINNRTTRWTLKWDLNPIPTLFTEEMLKNPSTLPTPLPAKRKPPKERNFQDDEIESFLTKDVIDSFDVLDENHAPEGFQCAKSADSIVFYHLVFNDGLPNILETIKVNKDLRVQLQYNGSTVPLPIWFTHGRNGLLSRFSQLNEFPNHIRLIAEAADCNSQSLLEEMKNRMYLKPKARPSYSAAMIRFALHLRYTSLQTYKLLLHKFPFPSISVLSKIQRGGVDALKAIKRLREAGEISSDVVLMVDEMYLQKGTQYQGGEYVGADEDKNLYKGVVVCMIVGLKKSIP